MLIIHKFGGKANMYYNVCENCESHLDPGESCTCMDNYMPTLKNTEKGTRSMRITKLAIKNLYGISEYASNGASVELSGQNGVGKTSVIDAIRYALTNKSDRDYILKNGEKEGEIFIETSTGLSIRRKPREGQADYKSIKKDGAEIQSPETFLKDIFTELQLSPIEFMNMNKTDQNRIILNMIKFDWDMNWVKEQFGEIPPDVNYEQNILSVLNEIQSEGGFYYRKRQDINRERRNKQSFIEDIGETLPAGYEADKWENESLSGVYTEIETIRLENSRIEKAKQLIENRNNKVRKFDADREIAISAIEKEISARDNQITNEVIR